MDALILDYGGVVMHEDPADYDAIGRGLGLADGELWAMVHSLPEYIPSRIGVLSGDQFQLAVREWLCQLAGPERADAAIASLLGYYAALPPIREVMRPLLAGLKGRVKLVLLSNSARGSTARFREQGLAEYFDAILCSGDTGMAKPDPRAYRLAAQAVQVPVARCAFVDDVFENVAAARALGMPVLHYHHERHRELLDALDRWDLPAKAA